jgi:predicted ATPase
VCSPQSIPLLAVEEIENHIHPHRLEAVLNLLRSLNSKSRPTQIILTTHSPQVLDLLKPEEVLIVERDPKRGTSLSRLAEKTDLMPFMTEMSLGEAWLSRMIGGVP